MTDPRSPAVHDFNIQSLPLPISMTLITIKGEQHEDIVTVNRDGTVVYGEGVDLDEVSRRFWEALAINIPPALRA